MNLESNGQFVSPAYAKVKCEEGKHARGGSQECKRSAVDDSHDRVHHASAGMHLAERLTNPVFDHEAPRVNSVAGGDDPGVFDHQDQLIVPIVLVPVIFVLQDAEPP